MPVTGTCALAPLNVCVAPPSTEQEIEAMPLGPPEATAVTAWVPDVEAVSAGAERVTDGVTLSTLMACEPELITPAALPAA